MTFFAYILLVLGGIFLLAGSFGVYRFDDVYLRIQFSSKALTFGLCFFLGGIGLLISGEQVVWKIILAVIFQFLTAPIAATMVAQAAMRRDQKPQSLENEEEYLACQKDLVKFRTNT